MNNVVEMKNQKNVEFFKNFLIHSDCQGKFGLRDCKKLLKGFESKEFKNSFSLL